MCVDPGWVCALPRWVDEETMHGCGSGRTVPGVSMGGTRLFEGIAPGEGGRSCLSECLVGTWRDLSCVGVGKKLERWFRVSW